MSADTPIGTYTVTLVVKYQTLNLKTAVRFCYSVQDRRLESKDPEEVKWLKPQKPVVRLKIRTAFGNRNADDRGATSYSDDKETE